MYVYTWSKLAYCESNNASHGNDKRGYREATANINELYIYIYIKFGNNSVLLITAYSIRNDLEILGSSLCCSF